MNTSIVLFAFRHALTKKGLTLTSVAQYIRENIEELPNEALKEMMWEVTDEYQHFENPKISGYLTAKQLVTDIRRELYGEEDDEEGPF